MELRRFQRLMDETFGERDRGRGLDGTFMWLVEEVGELAAAIRAGTPEDLREEFADCLAWLASAANVAGVDLEEAVEKKYAGKCPYCRSIPCRCEGSAKP